MDTRAVKIYALICSRNSNFSETSLDLFSYFKNAGIEVLNLIGYNSIFEAYYEGFKKISANPDDIIIFCHDDIEIKIPGWKLSDVLKHFGKDSKYGFLGVAGTSQFPPPCVWWYNQPSLLGVVDHGTKEKQHSTVFGGDGTAKVCDGVFLACRADLLNTICLNKPKTFIGNWDFYDIYYTFQAYLLGYRNYVTTKLRIRHESPGIPRETWDQNRLAFIEMYKDKL